MAVLRWFLDDYTRELNAELEKKLSLAANDIVNEAKAMMGAAKGGAVPPTNATTYGMTGKERRGKQRIKGHGTTRSAPGEAPAVQTGRLVNSIAQERTAPLFRRIGTNVKYGFWLEVGVPGGKPITAKGRALRWIAPDGSVMFRKRVKQGQIKPRPWLRPAMFRAKPKVLARFGQYE